MENIYELETWSHPSDYGGFSPVGDFLLYSRTRDSSILESVNYECILSELEQAVKDLGIDGTEPVTDDESGECQWVYDFRAGHWAVGWVEYILIRKDSPEELQKVAYEIEAALSNYQVMSEEKYFQAQEEAIYEYWGRCSLNERLEYCREVGESIFKSRYDDVVPDKVFDLLRDSDSFN